MIYIKYWSNFPKIHLGDTDVYPIQLKLGILSTIFILIKP